MYNKLLIGGEWRAAASGRRWTVVNPATEEPVADALPGWLALGA